ncbi:MAG: M24 family metallopeptidase [Pseudomonadota bacterium]
MNNNQLERESVGKNFSLQKMFKARENTKNALKLISQHIYIGMTELEAHKIADKILLDCGIDKIWHPTKIRFGTNTIKAFREPSEGNHVLGENDIYFIDIGAVWDGHEGDAGDSFVTGNDKEMLACIEDARLLFHIVEEHWKLNYVSGQELYQYAEEKAQKMGWKLNTDMKGHRLSDFPHAIYKAGSLRDFTSCPVTNLWVLEIQIVHPNRFFGAFYEDLLTGHF